MGTSLLFTGNPAQSRSHLDCALALYNPAEHRALATRFGQDVRVAAWSYRSLSNWMLGYPEAALTDAERALKDAREIGQAAELMHALYFKSFSLILCGNYAAATAEGKQLTALADEKDSLFFRTSGMFVKGLVMAQTGKTGDAMCIIKDALTASRAIGTTMSLPVYSSYLARCYAEDNRLEDAWGCINQAMTAVEATKERWWEAEIHRISGEIALKSPQPDAAKAEAHFERALAVARAQEAKSWELRAATSLARLWRDQGERDEAHDLLAPIYGWFTEGFDTLDLKEARALLDELHA